MSDLNLRTLADLRNSKPPVFFDEDQTSIKARLVSKFETLTNKTLFEGQPEMFMIETMAYALSVRSQAEQNAVLNNTIVWAEGIHVENAAANVSIYRLLATPALATLKFAIETIQSTDINIAAGARVSGVGFVFALVDDVIIPAGSLSASGVAWSEETGSQANDIPAFVINVPVDALPDGVAVFNEAISGGGADIEDIERLRERGANGNFKISKGGPRNGYRELVKGLHPDIVAVGVIKPEPGHIDIYPLMSDGIPSAEIKQLVFDGIDRENDAPMGDYIQVKDPVAVDFDFTLIIRIDAADSTIEDAGNDITEDIFTQWGKAMGIRVSPSIIITEIRKLAGVIDAEVDGLDYTDLAEAEFATLGTLTMDVRVSPNV